jgi:hypothetical protein
MGALDESGNQGGVTGSGVLCEIQYAITGGSATIKVEADTLRGGAVVGDAVTQPAAFDVVLANGFTLTTSSTTGGDVTTPGEGAFSGLSGSVAIVATADPLFQFVNWTGTGAAAGKIANVNAASTTITMDADYTAIANFAAVPETITTPTVAKTTIAPAIGTRVNSGRVETFVASGAVSNYGHALEYQFTWGDTTVSPWGLATQTHTYTYGGAGIVKTTPYAYNVTVQARCIAHPTVLSAASPVLALTSEPVKSTATATYAAYALLNRPDCWAFQRNCKGDTNGLGQGLGGAKVWVRADDLTLFSATYLKPQSTLLTINIAGIPGACADNNRIGQGLGGAKVWVRADDLSTFSANYLKPQSLIPVCSQTEYHYWTN